MTKAISLARAWLLAAGASVLSLGTAEAHHSFATHYDATKSERLTGVVTRFDFRSPHAFIFMNVTNESGGVTPYEVELHSVPIARTPTSRSTLPTASGCMT